MKNTLLALAILIGASLAAPLATAQENGIGTLEFDTSKHLLPVLVATDATGKVTKVDPAIKLRGEQIRQLENMIGAMITSPARDKAGNGIPSQFVLVFAVNPDEKNPQETTFTYMEAKVVQQEPLHWVAETRGSRVNKRFYLAPENQGQDVNRATGVVEMNHQRYSASQSGDGR